KKQLMEEYLKGQHLLTIQAPKELQEMESEFKAKMQSHSDIIEDLVKEKIDLKKQMITNHDEFKKEIVELRENNEKLTKKLEIVTKYLKFVADKEEHIDEDGARVRYLTFDAETR